MSTSPARPPVEDFDFYDPELPGVLHETFHEIRSKCPVGHSDKLGGYWLVTGHDEVREVLSDHETYSSAQGPTLPHVDALLPPIDQDPPAHRDYRKFLNPYFSRNRLAAEGEGMREVARELIDAFIEKGSCDVMADFASQFTASALAKFIFKMEDDIDFDIVRRGQEATEKITTTMAPEAWAELYGLVSEFLAKRRALPEQPDDLVAAILTAEVLGKPLTEAEQTGIVVLMFNGGLDTTRTAISNIILRATQHPGLEDQLRDTDWLDRNLDEFLRLDTPIQGLARLVAKDTEIAGQNLKEGDWVWASYGAANRDPKAFENPDSLDFDRGADGSLAFGLGVHRCIGSHFARLQIHIAIEELLGRLQDIKLQDGAEVRFLPGPVTFPDHVPVTFTARTEG